MGAFDMPSWWNERDFHRPTPGDRIRYRAFLALFNMLPVDWADVGGWRETLWGWAASNAYFWSQMAGGLIPTGAIGEAQEVHS